MSQQNLFTIALCGTPNVGKSTIFNALTKMHQHTGNWSGKTVACCSGQFHYKDSSCLVVDLPGTYSLRTHSEEEEIAREYIVSGEADLLLLVCDATCPERGLRLLKQIRDLEDSRLSRVILCVNLCDEAAKKGIKLNFDRLSERLNVPVIPCTARNRHGLDRLKNEIYEISLKNGGRTSGLLTEPESGSEDYPDSFAYQMCRCCQQSCQAKAPGNNKNTLSRACESCPFSSMEDIYSYSGEKCDLKDHLSSKSYSGPADSEKNRGAGKSECLSGCDLKSLIPDFSPAILAAETVTYKNPAYLKRQQKIDRLVTGRFTGGFLMLALLLGIFWLTITGANYPSSFLWDQLFKMETWLADVLISAGAPDWLISSMIYGVFRVVAWVVSVMLPPMAIFFPLFTVLEDLGYLPRAAFNMDCAFKKCKACGKQCLTMCLGNPSCPRLLINHLPLAK